MTIEEYLNNRIDDLEEGPCNSSLVQGKVLAYREILSKLPELEHDVTLKEVKEECVFHFQREGCSEKCPMNKPTIDCLAFTIPMRWDVDAIQKRMKEAQQ